MPLRAPSTLGVVVAAAVFGACASFDSASRLDEPDASSSDATVSDGETDTVDAGPTCLAVGLADSFERDTVEGEGWSFQPGIAELTVAISDEQKRTGSRSLHIAVRSTDAGNSNSGARISRHLGAPCLKLGFDIFLAAPVVSGFYLFNARFSGSGDGGATKLGVRVSDSSLTFYEEKAEEFARILVIVPIATNEWSRIELLYTAAPSFSVRLNGNEVTLRKGPLDPFVRFEVFELGVLSRNPTSEGDVYIDDLRLD